MAELTSGMNEIAQRIRVRRIEMGYSYQDLASKTGLSKSTLQRYETGGIKNLPLDKLNILSKALEVSPEYIMGWDKKKDLDTMNDDEVLLEITQRMVTLPAEKRQAAIAYLRFLSECEDI